MDVIASPLRTVFREFCVSHSTIREIRESFSIAGIPEGHIEGRDTFTSLRRLLVEDYYSSLSWGSLNDARRFLTALNYMLEVSGAAEPQKEALRDKCRRHGFEVVNDGVKLAMPTAKSGVKNLIFAANGPKPEIVLQDALENQVVIVKNEQYCLIYDRPISQQGLTWQELLDWWNELSARTDTIQTADEGGLRGRLESSLASEPERLLFRTYLEINRDISESTVPALLPQVYLHYDPYTQKQLGSQTNLARQRIDFLLLLPNHARVVIEVDGKQHYSDGDTSSPRKYALMVSEDRRLRLTGCELYRFGGYELRGEDGKREVTQFFQELFRKHNVN